MFFLIIVMLVLDFIWLSFNKKNYDMWIQGIQGHQLIVKFWASLIAYSIMIAAVYWILIPLVYQNPTDGFMTGAKIGFVIYGIYNSTNMAIFSNYNIQMAVVDTIWGTVLFGILGYLCSKRIDGKI